jgi:hypothetical protein
MAKEIVSEVKDKVVLEQSPYKSAEQIEAEADGSFVDTRLKHIKANTQSGKTDDQKIEDEVTNARADGKLNKKDRSWAKRYGDLRSYSAKEKKEIEKKHQEELRALKAQLETTSPIGTSHMTDEELIIFADKNPEAFRIMQAINQRENADRDRKFSDLNKRLDEKQKETDKAKAKTILITKHPNWEEITKSDAFHEWANEQPMEIQDWVYENSDNGMLLAKAITFYLAETGTKPNKTRKGKADAAQLVSTGGTSNAEVYGKPIYKMSWIEALDDSEYTDELQADIKLALKEGRVLDE